ncbi:MAG: hypothetical protein ACLFWM_05630 [Actinomycetota bacterium]
MSTHEEIRSRRRTAVGRSRFTVGQAVSAILGLVLVVGGGVAMARVGFDSLTGETTNVFGIDHTLLLGIVNVVVGLIFLSSASSMFGVRGTLISLGTLAVAFGAVVWIEPDPFVQVLGEGRSLGLAYLALGVIALVAGISTPTFVASSETAYDDEVVEETTTHR